MRQGGWSASMSGARVKLLSATADSIYGLDRRCSVPVYKVICGYVFVRVYEHAGNNQ